MTTYVWQVEITVENPEQLSPAAKAVLNTMGDHLATARDESGAHPFRLTVTDLGEKPVEPE